MDENAAIEQVAPTDGGRAYFFLESILTTEEEELDCQEVMAVIARYVDVEVATGTEPKDMAGVPVHLKHCPHCAQMYQTLRALAEMEAHGSLPDTEGLWHELYSAVGDGPEDLDREPLEAEGIDPVEVHSVDAEDPPGDGSRGGRSSLTAWLQRLFSPVLLLATLLVGVGA
jgi:hypothetical protein